ncbi:Rqc2 family fibronectin-binding protein [Geoalkalibacter subterraneus]|nr:NFACT RNA binding domain-containing protein [Geoalkalibacter subterraneus]
MDSLMLEAVVAELEDRLSGARFEKIYQPESDTLIAKLWTGRETLRLLFSASPRFSRLHLTEQKFANPSAPPRFCQLLRARLKRLVSVRRISGERIVEFQCSGPEKESYRLVVELMGRHANLLLVDAQGIIVDLWERRDASVGGRALLPGQPYQLPPPRPLQSLESWDGELPQDAVSTEDVARFLAQTLTPISWLAALDLASGQSAGHNLQELVRDLLEALQEKAFEPVVGTLADDLVVSPFAPRFLELKSRQRFDSPSQAAEAYYRQLIEESGDLGEQQFLRRLVARHQKRVKGRLAKIREQEKDLDKADKFRLYGELLLANMHLVRRGMEQVEVENYYEDPPSRVVIDLDPRRALHENADDYFRRYKKMCRGAEHVERRLHETQQEMDWIDGVAFSLSEAREAEDLVDIRSELEEAGLVPSAGRMEKSFARNRRPRPQAALSPGGFRVYWGKNSRTNDYVSRELASDGDFWFHAYQVPGSHVLLKVTKKGEAVPEEDLLYAAAVAAAYSRAAQSGKVEVMAARAEDVRKPKGARPGLVTVAAYRTVMVKPLIPSKESW